jgi:hypothetical protein
MSERAASGEVGPRQSFLRGTDYFSRWIDYDQAQIERMTAQIRNRGPNPKVDAQFVFKIFTKRYELLIEKYSRGDPLDELHDMLPDVVAGWEWARREESVAFSAAEMARRHGFRENFDAYSLALWMVSIALCLEVDDALFRRIVDLVGNEGEDRLYERLVAARIASRRSTETLVYPKPYELLDAAIDERDVGDRDRLVLRFLKAWYPGMRRAYWHDCHKGKDGGGYFGYWCFEAAGVTRAFGFDDAAWRDDPHYPKDLAAFRRR